MDNTMSLGWRELCRPDLTADKYSPGKHGRLGHN